MCLPFLIGKAHNITWMEFNTFVINSPEIPLLLWNKLSYLKAFLLKPSIMILYENPPYSKYLFDNKDFDYLTKFIQIIFIINWNMSTVYVIGNDNDEIVKLSEIHYELQWIWVRNQSSVFGASLFHVVLPDDLIPVTELSVLLNIDWYTCYGIELKFCEMPVLYHIHSATLPSIWS